ncbi:MAG TPA: hypothetical protein VN605_04530 [Thermoanaerobaculia bacterium]|nr:hypothetical protein [Thermoanaerobaculia bacterium]
MSEQLWYAGLPVVTTRSLAPEELKNVDAIVARGWTYSAAFALLVVALLAIAFLTTSVWTTLIAVMVFRGVLTQFPAFAPPWTARELRRDRAEGVVYVCQAMGDDDLPGGAIEVLPRSRVIWKRNGMRPITLERARVTTTAALPQHAAAAANFVRPLDDNEQVLVHQRPLSEGELRELDAYAPAVSAPRLVLVGVATFGAVVSYMLAMEGRITTLLVPAAFGVLTAVTGFTTFRAMRLRRRIEGDIRYGYVLIVRIRDGETLSVPHEFLPHSRILWTSAGEPANWRKIVSAR